MKAGIYSIYVLCDDNTWVQRTYRTRQEVSEHDFRMTAERLCGGFTSFGIEEDYDCNPEYIEEFPHV